MKLSKPIIARMVVEGRKLGVRSTPESMERIVEAATAGQDMLGPQLRNFVEFLRSDGDMKTIADVDGDAIVAEADEMFPLLQPAEDPWLALAKRLENEGQTAAAVAVKATVSALQSKEKSK